MVVFVDYGYLDLQAEAARNCPDPSALARTGGATTALARRPFPGWPVGMASATRRPPHLCGVEDGPDLELFDGAPGVAEASYGPDVHPEGNAGAGKPVGNPTAFPWRATVALAITAADGSRWNGTGWFAGPRVVVTAAHSLFVNGSSAPGRDGWVRSVTVMPGRRGGDLPYGAVTVGRQSFRVADGWVAARDGRADYGAVVLAQPLGRLTGWYGVGVFEDAVILRSICHVASYPEGGAGVLVQQRGAVEAVTANQVRCGRGMAAGASGGAFVRVVAGQPYVCAIHNYSGWNASLASRVTPAVCHQIAAWEG